MITKLLRLLAVALALFYISIPVAWPQGTPRTFTGAITSAAVATNPNSADDSIPIVENGLLKEVLGNSYSFSGVAVVNRDRGSIGQRATRDAGSRFLSGRG